MMLKARRVNGVKSASEENDHHHAPSEPHTCHLFTISILVCGLGSEVQVYLSIPSFSTIFGESPCRHGRACKLRKGKPPTIFLTIIYSFLRVYVSVQCCLLLLNVINNPTWLTNKPNNILLIWTLRQRWPFCQRCIVGLLTKKYKCQASSVLHGVRIPLGWGDFLYVLNFHVLHISAPATSHSPKTCIQGIGELLSLYWP